MKREDILVPDRDPVGTALAKKIPIDMIWFADLIYRILTEIGHG